MATPDHGCRHYQSIIATKPSTFRWNSPSGGAGTDPPSERRSKTLDPEAESNTDAGFVELNDGLCVVGCMQHNTAIAIRFRRAGVDVVYINP